MNDRPNAIQHPPPPPTSVFQNMFILRLVEFQCFSLSSKKDLQAILLTVGYFTQFLTCTHSNIFSPLASLGGILDSFINLVDRRILHILSIDGYDGVPRVQAGHERHTARHNTLNKRLKNFALLLNTTVALKKQIKQSAVITDHFY